jgi:hypothetical protein
VLNEMKIWPGQFQWSSTGYCYGVVSYKASHALRLLSDLLCVRTWVLIITDSSTTALWELPAETPSSEVGETWREWLWTLPKKYLYCTPQGSLTCREILRHVTDGLTSPRKEVVLRISIVFSRVWSRKPWVQWQAR